VATDFRSLLQAEATASGIRLTDQCLDRLATHYSLLKRWNRAVRLIGDTDPATVVRRHALESLALLPFVHEPRGSLLDIGSGNGYPAIPLKCALPDLRLAMIEPTIRKSVFLQTVAADLGLADTMVFRTRIDRGADLERLGRWDVISMRAVAAIPAVLAGAPASLRPRGRLILMVGEAGRRTILDLLVKPLELVADHQLAGSRGSWVVTLALTRSEEGETIH